MYSHSLSPFSLSGFSQKRPPNEVLRNKGGRVITLYGKSFTSYFNAVFLLLLHVPAAFFKLLKQYNRFLNPNLFYSFFHSFFSAEMVIGQWSPVISHCDFFLSFKSQASSFKFFVTCNVQPATSSFLHCQLITDH